VFCHRHPKHGRHPSDDPGRNVEKSELLDAEIEVLDYDRVETSETAIGNVEAEVSVSALRMLLT